MNKIKELTSKLNIKKVAERLMPVVSLAIVLAIWAIVSATMNVDVILPSPRSAFNRFFTLFGEATYWKAILGTSARALIGFAVSFLLALILAVVAYVLPLLGKLLSPIISVVRSMPTMSVILVIILWVPSKISPIIVAGLIAFPMLYAGIFGALNDVSKDLKNMAKLYKIPIIRQVAKIYIPETLPTVFATAQGVISLTLKVTISGEVLAQTMGSMGIYMQNARVYLDAASLFAWTITAIILGFVAEMIVFGIKKLIIRW